ncbi:MAG: type II secretion system protein N [Candidatus Binatia bacterium]
MVGGTKIFVFSARAVLLTLCSYFCALAVNSGVAMWFARPPSVTVENEHVQLRSAPAKPPLASYAIVYNRDLFNSVKAPTLVEGAATVAGNTGPLRLWGTAVGDTGSTFAIIEDLGTRTQGLYHKGDSILPGVILVEVHWDRVVIYRNGRRETLTLPTTPPTSVPLSTVTAAAEPGTSQEQDGIRQVAQDSFQIDRREVDRAINNLNDLFTQARAVPYS